MRKAILSMIIVLLFIYSGAWADVQVRAEGSTGLSVEGLKGYIGGADARERILVKSDEPRAYLMFYWDSKDLELSLTVADTSGKKVAELDLSRGNILTLSKPGNYVCILTARKGSGHWLCVALGSREWDP